jgi:predicted ATPase
VAAPELERLRLSDAVLRLVEWAAAGRPTLLVAEDVHRADRASLALAAHIGRRLGRVPRISGLGCGRQRVCMIGMI